MKTNNNDFSAQCNSYIFACIFGMDEKIIRGLKRSIAGDDLCMIFVDDVYLHCINSKIGSMKMLHRLAENYGKNMGEEALSDLFRNRILVKIKGTDMFYFNTDMRGKNNRELLRMCRENNITSDKLIINDDYMTLGRLQVVKRNLTKEYVMEGMKWIVDSVRTDLPDYVVKALAKNKIGSMSQKGTRCMRMLRLILESNNGMIGVNKFIKNICTGLRISDEQFKRLIKKTNVVNLDKEHGIVYSAYLRIKSGQTKYPLLDERMAAQEDCDCNFVECVINKY